MSAKKSALILHFTSFIKKHKKISLAALLIIIILAIIFRPQQSTKIETQTIKRGEIIESLSGTGTINSDSTVDLSFLAGGKVTYLGAKKGDHITAGQTIAVLDQRSIQKSLETTLRNYSEQRNSFDQTIDNNHAATPKDAINDTMKRILQNNQYDLEKAVLSVELQALAKEQSILTSPIAGVLIREDVTASGINIGPTDVFTVADTNNLTFKMEIDEADIGKIKMNQPVKINLDAFPNDTIDLTVTNIDYASHTTTTGGNAFYVEAKMPANDGNQYRIGMNGDAEVILNEKKDVLTVSLASLTDDTYVYVKTKNGYEKRKISLGIKNDTDAEVLSGLEAGDEVALTPDEAAKVAQKKFF